MISSSPSIWCICNKISNEELTVYNVCGTRPSSYMKPVAYTEGGQWSRRNWVIYGMGGNLWNFF